MPSLLTVREVARLLNIHGSTVRRWVDKGILRAYRINSRGDRRFKCEDIYRFLNELNSNRGYFKNAHLPDNGSLDKY
jgi:excisionase family DNA binding protein